MDNTTRVTTLALLLAAPLVAQTITIDAAANRAPISPLIYGAGLATEAELRDLNAPLNRLGGNATSRYNWQANVYNHAQERGNREGLVGTPLPCHAKKMSRINGFARR